MEELKVIDRRSTEAPETSVTVRDTSTNAIVMAAMNKGYEPAFIEKMLDLQERFEKNEARKAYHEAMSRFKANPPHIEKDRKVSFPAGGKQTEYTHASLANVSDKINSGLGEHGLSAAWKTEQGEKGITVTCTITHKLGHSESTSLFAAPDTSGSKNSIQAVGSTITYLERYTLLALTGLAAAEMDDDGFKSGETVEYITVDQQTDINDRIKATGTKVDSFLKYFEAESVDKLKASQYPEAISNLKKRQENIDKANAKKAAEREPGQDG